jgi:hypothetical protein
MKSSRTRGGDLRLIVISDVFDRKTASASGVRKALIGRDEDGALGLVFTRIQRS